MNSVTNTDPTEPLNETELARLDELFEVVNPGQAMVIEELDGFVTALVCTGDQSDPISFLSSVLGVAQDGQPQFPSAAVQSELEQLLTRHWRSVEFALSMGESLAPLLTEDDAGVLPGNLWALGFLRGIDARPEPWDEIEEDTLNQWLEPFEALAEEVDFESGARQLAIDEGEREQLLDEMFDTVFDAYQHFVRGDDNGPNGEHRGAHANRPVRH
jgi:uncharacterized protein